jgi:hypothetical protein
MYRTVLFAVILAGALTGLSACRTSDDSTGGGPAGTGIQPLERLSNYYARTGRGEPTTVKFDLGNFHNQGLQRCIEKHRRAGGVFMTRTLFCRIVTEAANEVIAEYGLGAGVTVSPVDIRVLFQLFDDLRELGLFNIYSRSPEYHTLLAHMLDRGYLDKGEHSELALLIDRLLRRGVSSKAAMVTADLTLRTEIGRLAAEVLEASLPFWMQRSSTPSGPKAGMEPVPSDDDWFIKATFKTAADLLGVAIAAATGAGTLAGGVASIGASYLMEIMINCWDAQPAGDPCGTDIADADYWSTWTGPFWY